MDELIRDPAALTAAGILTAAWLLAMLAVRIVRGPVEPEAAPPTSDLGPERPALANMLANGFEVKREAVPATLLDLATRDVVEIQGIGDMYVVHVRRADPNEKLTPYERRGLDVLHDRAEDGMVPAGARTTGPRRRARAWWKGFRNEVIDEAQSRGLSRNLWSPSVLAWLSVLALAPAPFVYMAFRELEAPFAYVVAALLFIEAHREGRRQRHTDTGLSAATRWLGVRRFLREEPAFPELPPTAVEIWDRHMAYGAALGAARSAVRAIPMGADEDRRAWSAYGGTWREVLIRYPRNWPPAWGWRPWVALLASIGVGLLSAGIFALAFGVSGFFSETPGSWVPATFLVVPSILATWSATTLVRAAADLGSGDEVSGLVLRAREFGGGEDSEPRCYVAVDDGRSAKIRAWRVRPEIYRFAGVQEDAEVTATVTRHLRFVRELRRP